ncbi:MAG: hypothetical protein COW00_13170 [Bdellovibrio sp. CG12_big_fil_rev_8_21_14_0_65_39_13]|nr:MAG: hypothetical protein COW78_11220 [Bdellovibrio sp. CG22_combo_CG10-13_8_21_14_all_39_27]PIQ58880.1 MAG: hypothetical protein COW00_13170 [Bdellovibrio sp. CG12_big_fil_rev_8_21_14_0_65_39_13]PIR35971.1 MAG: hypothetical protein COV37_05545 [Bdellovibrio sp. CG11_big_fil_rev_8_21_14_0_20_39_38]
MVLRIIALSFFLTFPAFAKLSKKERDQNLFNDAKLLYSRGKYKESLQMLEARYNFKSKETPSGAMILAAWDLEKLEEYIQAQNLIAEIIRSRFASSHNSVMRQYKSDGAEGIEGIPPKLIEIYHRRAFLLSKIYQQLYFKVAPEKRDDYKRQALMYVEIIANQDDYEDESYEEIPKDIEAFDQKIKEQTWVSQFFMSTAWTSWRDRLDLIVGSGDRISIKSSVRGLSLGAGWSFQKLRWRLLLESQFTYASAVAGRESSTLSYFEPDVKVWSFGIVPAVHYRPFSGDASLGISIPVVYRNGNYTEPAGFVLEGKSILAIGYGFDMNWDLNQWTFFSRVANLSSMSSSYWQFGLRYHF